MEPITLVKGDETRVAQTPSESVALRFDGFRPAEESPAPQAEEPQATEAAPSAVEVSQTGVSDAGEPVSEAKAAKAAPRGRK